MELKRELTVSPGQSTAVEAELLRADLDVTPPIFSLPLLVEWSCEVLEYDLAVGAELFAGGERLAVVYPQRRVASTSACAFVLPRGCALPVVLRVALDNSFSLLRGKLATVVVTARAADDPAAASALESASQLLDVGDPRVCNARATLLSQLVGARHDQQGGGTRTSRSRCAVAQTKRLLACGDSVLTAKNLRLAMCRP